MSNVLGSISVHPPACLLYWRIELISSYKLTMNSNQLDFKDATGFIKKCQNTGLPEAMRHCETPRGQEKSIEGSCCELIKGKF